MMKGLIFIVVSLMVLSTVVVVATGCGSPTPEEAKTQLETDLKDLQVALQGMLSPTVYTSTDNFNAAWKEVEDAYNAVVKSAKEVKEVNVENLQSAFDEVKKAVGNIDSKDSLQTKASDIMDALTNFQKVWQETFSDLNNTQ
jgi:membrane-associated HD superfamily phosphohydrolase